MCATHIPDAVMCCAVQRMGCPSTVANTQPTDRPSDCTNSVRTAAANSPGMLNCISSAYRIRQSIRCVHLYNRTNIIICYPSPRIYSSLNPYRYSTDSTMSTTVVQRRANTRTEIMHTVIHFHIPTKLLYSICTIVEYTQYYSIECLCTHEERTYIIVCGTVSI